MPLHGVFGNWLVATVISHLARIPLTDLGPFRAITRQTLQRLLMEERTYGWPSEMIVKAAQLGRAHPRGSCAISATPRRTIEGVRNLARDPWSHVPDSQGHV